MKALVVGGGGREHALAWHLANCGHQVFCAPGNAGIAHVAQCEPISAMDLPDLTQLALRQKIDLTILGPEAPLVGCREVLHPDGVLLVTVPRRHPHEWLFGKSSEHFHEFADPTNSAGCSTRRASRSSTSRSPTLRSSRWEFGRCSGGSSGI